MLDEKLIIRCQREVWTNKIAVRMGINHQDGTVTIARSPIMTNVSLGESVQPTLELSQDEAQMLMDELFAAGIRPSEGMESMGQLAAVQKHLEDMQKIAFSLLAMDDAK